MVKYSKRSEYPCLSKTKNKKLQGLHWVNKPVNWVSIGHTAEDLQAFSAALGRKTNFSLIYIFYNCTTKMIQETTVSVSQNISYHFVLGSTICHYRRYLQNQMHIEKACNDNFLSNKVKVLIQENLWLCLDEINICTEDFL